MNANKNKRRGMFVLLKTDKSEGWIYTTGTMAELAILAENCGHAILSMKNVQSGDVRENSDKQFAL